MADQEEPDHTEDPRKEGTGQGYPETQPGDATPDEGTEEGPAAGTDQDEPEPGTDRDVSTGNPDAAG